MEDVPRGDVPVAGKAVRGVSDGPGLDRYNDDRRVGEGCSHHWPMGYRFWGGIC